jgi:hypothetical protein
MQSLFNKLKATVSRDKHRLRTDTFDLDFTWITSRIAAMGFPAASGSVESTYRNRIDDVAALLDRTHSPDHYLVFNVSQRAYDYAAFHHRVVDWCGFPDHHAPPLSLLVRTVVAMHDFLAAHPRNVVVVHCLAGKGRTGTVIVSFFLFVGLFRSPTAASVYFAAKRSTNHWGVTGPSQQRYVSYVHQLVTANVAPTSALFVLSSVELRPVPHFSFGVGRAGLAAVLRVKADNCSRLLYAGPTGSDAPCFDAGTFPNVLLSAGDVLVSGDIDISVKNVRVIGDETVLRCGFNVSLEVFAAMRELGMDPNGPPPAHIALKFTKSELDGAQGDKRFANDFCLIVNLLAAPSTLPPPPIDASLSSAREIAGFHDVGADDPLRSAERAHDAAPSPRAIDSTADLYRWRPPPPANGVAGSICFFDSPTVADEVAAAHLKVADAADMVTEKGGWLTKRGHVVKNFKRRWFVLNDDQMRYFKSPGTTACQGTIALSDIWAVHAVKDVRDADTGRGPLSRSINDDDDDDDNNNNNNEVEADEAPAAAAAAAAAGDAPRSCLFELVTSSRTFLLIADNPRDRDDWIDTIRAALMRFAAHEKKRQPIGKLHMRVSQARDIQTQSANTYCVLQYAKQRHRTGKADTALGGSMSNPIWLESSREVCFDIAIPSSAVAAAAASSSSPSSPSPSSSTSPSAPLTGSESPSILRNRFVSASVWLESQYSADQCLGEAILPLDSLPVDEPNAPPEWHVLNLRNKRDCGALMCTAWIEVVSEQHAALQQWLGSGKQSGPRPGAVLRSSKSQSTIPKIEISAAAGAESSAQDSPTARDRGLSAPVPSSIPSAIREALDLPQEDGMLNSSEFLRL